MTGRTTTPVSMSPPQAMATEGTRHVAHATAPTATIRNNPESPKREHANDRVMNGFTGQISFRSDIFIFLEIS